MTIDGDVASRSRLTRRQLLWSTTSLVAVAAFPAFSVVASTADDAIHGWLAGDAFEAWIGARLADAERAVVTIKAATPTIAGTLEPYDRARNALALASNQAEMLGRVGATEALRDAARRSIDRAAAATVAFDLDAQIHAALRALSRTPEVRRADAATRRYIDRALLRGRLAGADRDEATRAQVRHLQARIADIGARFLLNMQAAETTVSATASELKGLPADVVARHPPDARGVVTLPASPLVLRFADDPALRRHVYLAAQNRGYPANAPVVVELAAARAELASVLGFANYADLALADQMIGTAAAAASLLDRIEVRSRPIATREAAAVQAFARRVDPAAIVTVADAAYWSERYRRDRFGIDGQDVRAYLPYAQVQAGIMDFAARFFGVRFAPVDAGQAWHPQVAVFDVHDAAPGSDGNALGRIYLDTHARPGKDQTFATAPLVPGIRGRQRPEGVILCNLPGGTPDDPGLLSHSDVVNFLHEFGHLMHHVLAGQNRWSGLGAFDTEEDFLEAPSQMLEEFAHDPSVLQRFARHYQTGETLSADTIDRLGRSIAFGRAAWVRSQLQRARFALAIHREAGDRTAIKAENDASLRRLSSYPLVPGTHEYAASPHLVGYGPNYYMYLLDKVIAVDFAARFPRDDPTAGPTAATYRHRVLKPGAGRSGRQLVHDFLGRDERLDALSTWMEGGSERR